MRKLLISALALLASTAFALNPSSWHQAEIASSVVKIMHPSVVAEHKNQHVTEVYMELKNTGSDAHALIAATSPDAHMVQLHTMYKVHGVMHMHPVKAITLAPHHMRNLHWGGFHVMLINTTHQLHADNIVDLTLIFADGSWKTLHVKVK